jgi:hypothetical protein
MQLNPAQVDAVTCQGIQLIYSQNGKRMAVIITLPFITNVQSQLSAQMIEYAHRVNRDGGK